MTGIAAMRGEARTTGVALAAHTQQRGPALLNPAPPAAASAAP